MGIGVKEKRKAARRGEKDKKEERSERVRSTKSKVNERKLDVFARYYNFRGVVVFHRIRHYRYLRSAGFLCRSWLFQARTWISARNMVSVMKRCDNRCNTTPMCNILFLFFAFLPEMPSPFWRAKGEFFSVDRDIYSNPFVDLLRMYIIYINVNLYLIISIYHI